MTGESGGRKGGKKGDGWGGGMFSSFKPGFMK